MKKLILIFFSFLFLSALQAQVVINPCARATTIHIVVIGSSTAAGTGPTNSANAWVNRYRDYIQSINPSNQVTNLAVGGTTTYHIMPDWFVPSIGGRPSVNPAKNVSQAISLGADAIIVNMPSNDAANGFGVSEQMFNFITISNSADSAGIPVWVCTTQPRNGFNAAKKAIQTGVRDSVLSYFGAKAIDFWTGFADTANNIISQWDSGDGVHLNDTAHAVLNNRVIAKGLPNIVSDTLAFTDHMVNSIYLSNTSVCGDSSTQLSVVVTNLGITSLQIETLQTNQYNNTNSSSMNLSAVAISNLGACVSDTFTYNINSFNGVDLSFRSYIQNSGDVILQNDTSKTIALYTNGHPNILGTNDTVLLGNAATLLASTALQDTIVWYDAPVGGTILAYGNQYSISTVMGNQTIYPEAVRGPLHYTNSLFTVANTATNWNGVMFNIVALQDITIDSLQIKVNSTGIQGVQAYRRMGSIVGHEMNASAWNAWGVDTVNAINAGEFKTIDFPDVSLQPNDTLGVYIHMQNQGATLSYLNSSSAIYSNTEIKVQDGKGSAYTFGTTYSPRNWSGEVFYHYGFNPKGDCTSDRIPVSAIVRWPNDIRDLDEDALQIFPNPTDGILSFRGKKIPSTVELFDVQGRKVLTQRVFHDEIDLSSLNIGLYLLSFEIKGIKTIRKIVVE